jgi:hypothetical protein
VRTMAGISCREQSGSSSLRVHKPLGKHLLEGCTGELQGTGIIAGYGPGHSGSRKTIFRSPRVVRKPISPLEGGGTKRCTLKSAKCLLSMFLTVLADVEPTLGAKNLSQ